MESSQPPPAFLNPQLPLQILTLGPSCGLHRHHTLHVPVAPGELRPTVWLHRGGGGSSPGLPAWPSRGLCAGLLLRQQGCSSPLPLFTSLRFRGPNSLGASCLLSSSLIHIRNIVWTDRRKHREQPMVHVLNPRRCRDLAWFWSRVCSAASVALAPSILWKPPALGSPCA